MIEIQYIQLSVAYDIRKSCKYKLKTNVILLGLRRVDVVMIKEI